MAFDRTIQETNLRPKALLERIGGDDRHRAYVVLQAGLHALRDRLSARKRRLTSARNAKAERVVLGSRAIAAKVGAPSVAGRGQ